MRTISAIPYEFQSSLSLKSGLSGHVGKSSSALSMGADAFHIRFGNRLSFEANDSSLLIGLKQLRNQLKHWRWHRSDIFKANPTQFMSTYCNLRLNVCVKNVYFDTYKMRIGKDEYTVWETYRLEDPIALAEREGRYYRFWKDSKGEKLLRGEVFQVMQEQRNQALANQTPKPVAMSFAPLELPPEKVPVMLEFVKSWQNPSRRDPNEYAQYLFIDFEGATGLPSPDTPSPAVLFMDKNRNARLASVDEQVIRQAESCADAFYHLLRVKNANDRRISVF